MPRDLGALCLELLRQDPVERPTAAQLRARLLEGDEPLELLSRRVDTGFVGRKRELAALNRAFEATRIGESSVCILHGESGVGKSRTVRQFIGELRQADSSAIVLEGQCHEREAVPYKTIDGVLDSIVRYLLSFPDADVAPLLPTRAGLLAQVFPALRRVPSIARQSTRAGHEPPADPRTRAFRELRDLLTRLAFAHPVVIAIDDLQWADEDGLRALAEILRPPESPPLLVIGTLRTSAAAPPGGQLQALVTALSVEVRDLHLDVLDHEDCRQLAAQLANERGITDPDVDRIALESGGHPLFIEQLVDGVGETTGDDLSLDHTIWARITALGASPRRLAEIVALAGKPIDPSVAVTAANLDDAEQAQAITELCILRIARRSADRQLDTYHGRIRDAVLARLELGRHTCLHARLALAYEAERQQDCEAIATHWQEAGEPARALHFIARAGDTAARTLAFDRAAVRYQQAIEIASDNLALRRDLQCRLGDVLANAGRGALAAAQFHAAAVTSSPEVAIVLHAREADQLVRSGHLARGLETTTRILAMIGIAVPRSRAGMIASLLKYRLLLAIRGFRFHARMPHEVPPGSVSQLEICLRAARALGVFDPLLGRLLHTRSLLWALRVGEPDQVCRAFGLELKYLGAFGRPARRRFERLFGQAQAIAQTFTEAHPYLVASMGMSQILDGVFETGLQNSDRSIEFARKRSPVLVHEIVTMELYTIIALADLGRYSELRRRQQQGLRDALSRGDVYAQVVFSTGASCIGWLVADRSAEAETAIACAMQAWPTTPVYLQHLFALSGRFLVSLYNRDARMSSLLAE